jgi:hypothetical protein
MNNDIMGKGGYMDLHRSALCGVWAYFWEKNNIECMQ